jgi:sugar phosphate isomerase/epimerase
MAIKFAFSTVACPDSTLKQVAEQAKEMGYDAVELRTLGAGSAGLSCDPALSDPGKVAQIFNDAGIEPLCLSTSLALHHRGTTEFHRANFNIQRALEDAKTIGCQAVRIFGNEVGVGENQRGVIARIAERAKPLAEKAADLGIELLFENAGSFPAPKEWWWLLNIVEHPMVGLMWNQAVSAANDDEDKGGWVSVSTLNSRIRIAKVKDISLGQGAGYVPLGQGDVGIKNFIQRLLGIGFDGYITVEWDRLWLPSLAPAQEYLPEALASMKSWIAEVQEHIAQADVSRGKAAIKAQKTIDKAMTKMKEARAAAAAGGSDSSSDTASATATLAPPAKPETPAQKEAPAKAEAKPQAETVAAPKEVEPPKQIEVPKPAATPTAPESENSSKNKPEVEKGKK